MTLIARADLRQHSWQAAAISIRNISREGAIVIATLLTTAQFSTPSAFGELVTHITIDGSFADWASVPSHTDAAIGQFHTGTNIPDVHTTDPWNPALPGELPSATNHPDVDLLEYKFTHDESNLYAYFRATGFIGRTIQRPPGATSGPQGRFYVIVTIDVDNRDDTGYWLHEGGYAPTSRGYDMNMELEFFDGSWNTGHYLSHDALSENAQLQDTLDLTNGEYDGISDGPYTPGFVQPAPGNYPDYTQWVYHDNDTLTLVSDRGPIVPGIMSMALSPDGHEIEFRAPFKGFLNTESGEPNMALGKTIDISFSLEASGQLAPGGTFGSDTGDPIIGYYLGRPAYTADFDLDGDVDGDDLAQWQDDFGVNDMSDADDDGDSDGADFLAWQRQLGSGVAAASANVAVPEPAMAMLVIVAAVGIRRIGGRMRQELVSA